MRFSAPAPRAILMSDVRWNDQFRLGKGVYVWQPGSIEHGNPDAIAARFKLAGVQTATIEVSDGFQSLGGLEVIIQNSAQSWSTVSAPGAVPAESRSLAGGPHDRRGLHSL